MVDSVSVRFKNARVEKVPLNICIEWNAGTACVSECVLKTLACRGLRVSPSSVSLKFPSEGEVKQLEIEVRLKRGGGGDLKSPRNSKLAD